MTMRGLLVVGLLAALLVAVRSFPVAQELINEESEGDNQYEEVEIKPDVMVKRDEVAGSGSGAARKDDVAAAKTIAEEAPKKDNPQSDESESPASGEEETSGDDSTDVAASGNSDNADEVEDITPSKGKIDDEKDDGDDEEEVVDVKVEDAKREDNGSTPDNSSEEETWNGEKKSKVSKPSQKTKVASKKSKVPPSKKSKVCTCRTMVKAGKPCKRDCGCDCDCDEPEEEHEGHHCCHHHCEGCHGDHECEHHHCHEGGHHEHEDCCHHHGHHHGFVHEWGEECCGDHEGHDCCGEHEHCHHDCGDHEHEHCHKGEHCCHHEEEEEEHPCCCCHKRSKCPKGKKRCCCCCKKKKRTSKKDPVSGSARNLVLHPGVLMKKQTVHVGYGYSSGDNYRLGFQQGGMGALASQFTGEINPQDNEEGVSAPLPESYAGGGNYPNQNFGPQNFGAQNFDVGNQNFGNQPMRHAIQSPIRDKRNNFGGFGSHGFGNLESGMAHGSATPYGHPVTHPGFTTMGFPGHALASQDVRNGIPMITSQAYNNVNL